MKLKTYPSTISIGLLVLALAIFFTAPAAAQNPGNQPLTWGTQLASNTSNPRIKAGNIDEKSANASPDSADFWFDKGALCATYGNDRAAVSYFQKAISLNPNLSGAYFEQGISYGQLGDFDKALTLVNRALEMEPKNGLYLYGRGRVHLLAGKQDQAMEDFKNAAALDDEDAQNYLKHVARHSN